MGSLIDNVAVRSVNPNVWFYSYMRSVKDAIEVVSEERCGP
jgi:hypothetical protein